MKNKYLYLSVIFLVLGPIHLYVERYLFAVGYSLLFLVATSLQKLSVKERKGP
jgi:hypothetical protein